ncbi:hypothetical protein SEVIR_1G314866v4 [Setaria viridis]
MSPHTRRQVFRSEQANPSRDINVKRSSVKPIPAFPRVQPSQGKTRIRSIAPSPLSGLRGRMWPVSYRGLGRTRHAAPPAGVATAPVTPTCRGAVVGSECYLGARAVLRQPSLSFCHWSLVSGRSHVHLCPPPDCPGCRADDVYPLGESCSSGCQRRRRRLQPSLPFTAEIFQKPAEALRRASGLGFQAFSLLSLQPRQGGGVADEGNKALA